MSRHRTLRWAALVTMLLAAVPLSALLISSPSEAASTPVAGGVYTLVPGASGKCLEVPNGSTTAGTQAQIWDCTGGAGQTWTRTASGELSLYDGGNRRCLDANGQGTTAGTKAIIWSCNGQPNQRWTVNSDGTIKGTQSGLCLDVSAASTANGALVQLWTCNGPPNQRWPTS